MELSTQFEALMNRSPISQVEVTSFLRDMRRTPSGTLVTSKLLAERLQCESEAQAIQAFELLEIALQSETEGSIEFRTEIGRYRFLNEIIRILSPKYLGDKTPVAVRERAIKFLEDAAGSKRKRWFPSEHSKVQAVYDSLVEGGVIKKSSPITEADEEAELQKSIFDRAENAAVLKKLLSSRDPVDLQAANRLIKNLVEEESRRIERRAELHSLLDRIETSTSLMTEMLSQRQIDKEIVDELADGCKTLRQRLGGVATETNDETTSLLQASENLEKVLNLYEERKNLKEEFPAQELLVVGASENSSQQVLSLADELLMGLDINFTLESQPTTVTSVKSDLSSACARESEIDNLLNLEVSIPSNVAIPVRNVPDRNETTGQGLDEIGRLSRELMDKSLKGNYSVCAPEFKKADKTPLSQIRMPSSETVVPVKSTLSAQSNLGLDLDFLDALNSPVSGHDLLKNSDSVSTTQNVLIDTSNDMDFKDKVTYCASSKKISNSSSEPIINPAVKGTGDNYKALLSSIKTVDLETIDSIENLKPLNIPLEEGCEDVNLTLTFGTSSLLSNRVKVAVVTLTNRSSKFTLYNYVFQLLPPKGIQVKLLAPETMELPAWKKSFLPPPVLNQIALIVIPDGLMSPSIKESKLYFRFILSYMFGDETALINGDFGVPYGLYE